MRFMTTECSNMYREFRLKSEFWFGGAEINCRSYFSIPDGNIANVCAFAEYHNELMGILRIELLLI